MLSRKAIVSVENTVPVVNSGISEGVNNPEVMSIDSEVSKKTSQSTRDIQELSFPSLITSDRPETATGKTQPVQRSLSMAPAMKMIFPTRFAPETTADDIIYYIKSKIEGDYFLRCYKLRSAFSESRSSFKIVVPENIFVQLILKEFWPARAFIKEFVERSDNLAHLPLRPDSVPKN